MKQLTSPARPFGEVRPTRDDDWVRTHLNQLIIERPGQWVAVSNGEIVAVGLHPERVERIARRRYPQVVPSVLKIPSPEDLRTAA